MNKFVLSDNNNLTKQINFISNLDNINYYQCNNYHIIKSEILLKDNYNCEFCLKNKNGIEYISDFVKQYNGQLLSPEYKNNRDKLLFKCNNPFHTKFELSSDKLLNQITWCTKSSCNYNKNEYICKQIYIYLLSFTNNNIPINEFNLDEIDINKEYYTIDELKIITKYNIFNKYNNLQFIISDDINDNDNIINIPNNIINKGIQYIKRYLYELILPQLNDNFNYIHYMDQDNIIIRNMIYNNFGMNTTYKLYNIINNLIDQNSKISLDILSLDHNKNTKFNIICENNHINNYNYVNITNNFNCRNCIGLVKFVKIDVNYINQHCLELNIYLKEYNTNKETQQIFYCKSYFNHSFESSWKQIQSKKNTKNLIGCPKCYELINFIPIYQYNSKTLKLIKQFDQFDMIKQNDLKSDNENIELTTDQKRSLKRNIRNQKKSVYKYIWTYISPDNNNSFDLLKNKTEFELEVEKNIL